jgi:chromate transporter
MSAPTASVHPRASPLEVLLVFLKLGVTSFGGPVAHIGFLREELVARRRWLDEHTYADLVALCQFLPGPASSQVGMSVGHLRAGIPGAIAAWVGFTAPSAVALLLFAYGMHTLRDVLHEGVLHGLKVVTVAVVAQAVWAMGRALCTDRTRVIIAALATGACLWRPGSIMQVAVLVAAGVAGWRLLPAAAAGAEPVAGPAGRSIAIAAWVSFFALLLLLPVAARLSGPGAVAMFDSFYRAGALVFGGGHVVLPLLEAEVVAPGWVSRDDFLAGYGAAQAVPGPLFTFAAYLGAMMRVEPSGWLGGLLCLTAIFLPAFLLVLGALPFWQQLRGNRSVRAALAGINAAVVGLLLAALYDPVAVGGISSVRDAALALAAFALLRWRVAPWLVVVLTAAAAGMLYAAG